MKEVKTIERWNTNINAEKFAFLKRLLGMNSVNAWKWTSHRVSLDFLLREVNEFFYVCVYEVASFKAHLNCRRRLNGFVF